MSEKEGSTNTVQIRPASYWTSHGLSSGDATKMVNLQERLINGSPSISPFGPMQFGGGTLGYHESLLPYWDAFANTTGVLGNSFSMKYVELPSIIWQTITPKISGIKNLSLEENQLGAEGYSSLARFLSANKSLEELSIGHGNDLTDLCAAKSLSEAMKNHPTLHKVNAVHVEIGGNYHLDSPSPDIAEAFIEGCANCTELNINRVGMNDECGAEAYGKLVRRNKKLTLLAIFWEYFTSKGVDAITKGVFDTTSLNDIADSNHKCTIYISESNDDPNADVATKMMFVNGLDSSDTLKIRYKLQRALFGVGREPMVEAMSDTVTVMPEEGKELDLTLFNDVPLGLVPKVLEFMLKKRMVVAHEYNFDGYYFNRSYFMYYDEEEREYLNRLFQAMKGWVVPLLFADAATSIKPKRKRMAK